MLTVRPARPEDDAALQPIDLATWTSDVSPMPSGVAGPVLETADDVAGSLVAELDGTVVGYVRLRQPGPLPSHAHVLVVNGLAVDPARQRSGVGRALVQAALELARRRGARKVTLRVLAPNTAARRLYEAAGFVVEGVLAGEFHLDGRDVDDVLMARHLDA